MTLHIINQAIVLHILGVNLITDYPLAFPRTFLPYAHKYALTYGISKGNIKWYTLLQVYQRMTHFLILCLDAFSYKKNICWVHIVCYSRSICLRGKEMRNNVLFSLHHFYCRKCQIEIQAIVMERPIHRQYICDNAGHDVSNYRTYLVISR